MKVKAQFSLLLLMGCINLYASAADWQSSLEVKTITGEPLSPSALIVPKQSVEMTATVWMPEDINWFPQFPEWDIPQATVVPMFMLSPSIERQRSGRTQRGATQNYLVTPLAEGDLNLSQSSLRVYPDQPDSPVLPLTPVSLRVTMPPEGGNIEQFLPATKLKLTQSFYLLEGDNTRPLSPAELSGTTLKTGQMIERRILIEADGIQGKLIPALNADHDVIENHAESTDVTNYDEFIGGTRTEHRLYPPRGSENRVLPAISVRWFNTRQQRFMTARLPEVSFKSEAPTTSTPPTLGPTLSDRLQMLPARLWMALAAVIILSVIVIVFGKKMLRRVKQTLHFIKRFVAANRTIRLLRLIIRVIIYGTDHSGSIVLFNALTAETRVFSIAKNINLRQWISAAYSPHSVPFPSRFKVACELAAGFIKSFSFNGQRVFQEVVLPEINCDNPFAKGKGTP